MGCFRANFNAVDYVYWCCTGCFCMQATIIYRETGLETETQGTLKNKNEKEVAVVYTYL